MRNELVKNASSGVPMNLKLVTVTLALNIRYRTSARFLNINRNNSSVKNTVSKPVAERGKGTDRKLDGSTGIGRNGEKTRLCCPFSWIVCKSSSLKCSSVHIQFNHVGFRRIFVAVDYWVAFWVGQTEPRWKPAYFRMCELVGRRQLFNCHWTVLVLAESYAPNNWHIWVTCSGFFPSM